MDRYLILTCTIIALSTCFLRLSESAEADVVNICAFSKDPDQYIPNCYDCPKVVYPNALMACINATEMPKNITYKQAKCLEKNCDIHYPSPTPADISPDQFDPITFFQRLAQLVQGKKKRSVDDNSVAGARSKTRAEASLSDSNGGNVVKEVSVLVVDDGPLEFGEPEYM